MPLESAIDDKASDRSISSFAMHSFSDPTEVAVFSPTAAAAATAARLSPHDFKHLGTISSRNAPVKKGKVRRRTYPSLKSLERPTLNSN